uniref:Integrase core domain containing protein n=1 Tax=Solanum tuberosum TaxID=4113 RepID=M1DS74_SOLTU
MTTLLHHIKPWMWKLIVQSEERVEKRMEAKMDQKVQAVHKWLDAFELRVLERPAPTTDMSSFQGELDSQWADVDAILATVAVEPQVAPTALIDDTVLDALFSGTAEEEPEPTRTKDEELSQQRVSESVAGASSSAPIVEVPPIVRDDVSTTDGAVRVTESTTEGAMMDDVGTTEGDPSIVPADHGKPDPLYC